MEVTDNTLRKAGDFKNKASVEYATIQIEMPAEFVPSNLMYDHPGWEKGPIKGLSVTPTGRLTWKSLYLDSEELAFAFREYLYGLFENRKYAHDCTITVKVSSSTETKTVTKYKERHSAAVRETLAIDHNFVQISGSPL